MANTGKNSIEVHCLSITLLLALEWGYKPLKHLQVRRLKGLMGGVQELGSGGNAENLKEKKGVSKNMLENSKAPAFPSRHKPVFSTVPLQCAVPCSSNSSQMNPSWAPAVSRANWKSGKANFSNPLFACIFPEFCLSKWV